MNENIFCENSTIRKPSLKKLIKKENYIKYECNICKNTGIHLNKPLVLQLDHINGINNDNRIENLRWVCPNCHSQTETYAGKNRSKSKIKRKFITEKLIIDTITSVNNINQLLLKIGASNTNGNYKKVKRIMEKYNLNFPEKINLIVTDKQRKRKVDWPSKDILKKEIKKFPMTKLAIKYGVSDKAIKKWCKYYDINSNVGRGYWTKKKSKNT